MNTIEDLVSSGIPIQTSKNMISNYSSRIGQPSGVLIITDVNYDIPTKKRYAKLKCSLCGATGEKEVVKWRDLIKTCNCQQIKPQKIIKIQKEVLRNNDLSYLEKIYGNFKVNSFVYVDNKTSRGKSTK